MPGRRAWARVGEAREELADGERKIWRPAREDWSWFPRAAVSQRQTLRTREGLTPTGPGRARGLSLRPGFEVRTGWSFRYSWGEEQKKKPKGQGGNGRKIHSQLGSYTKTGEEENMKKNNQKETRVGWEDLSEMPAWPGGPGWAP